MLTPSQYDIEELRNHLKSPMNCLWHNEFSLQSSVSWLRKRDTELYKYGWWNIIHEIGHQYLDHSNYLPLCSKGIYDKNKNVLTEYEVRYFVYLVLLEGGWKSPLDDHYFPDTIQQALEMEDPNYSKNRLDSRIRSFYEQYDYNIFKHRVNYGLLQSIGIKPGNLIRTDYTKFHMWNKKQSKDHRSYLNGWNLDEVIKKDGFRNSNINWNERTMVRINPMVEYQHGSSGQNRIYIKNV